MLRNRDAAAGLYPVQNLLNVVGLTEHDAAVVETVHFEVNYSSVGIASFDNGYWDSFFGT